MPDGKFRDNMLTIKLVIPVTSVADPLSCTLPQAPVLEGAHHYCEGEHGYKQTNKPPAIKNSRMNEYCVVLSTTKSFHCFRIRFLSERGEQCGIVYQGWSWWIFWKWTAGNNLWDIQFMSAELLDLSLRWKPWSKLWIWGRKIWPSIELIKS